MCTCVPQITSLHLITIKLISGFSSLLHYFSQCINVPNYRVSSSQLYLTQESNHRPLSSRTLIGQSPRYWPLIGWQLRLFTHQVIHLVGVCPASCCAPGNGIYSLAMVNILTERWFLCEWCLNLKQRRTLYFDTFCIEFCVYKNSWN